MKKVLKLVAAVIGAVILIAGCYVAYVFIDYHRIEDNLTLDIAAGAQAVAEDPDATGAKAAGAGPGPAVPVNESLQILSWNIGFGAYLQDYSFFMDGGKYSRAYSRESVEENMKDINGILAKEDADFYFVQEVDQDSTRAYHVDEQKAITDAPAFADRWSTFAMNYDSPYLFYPLTSPHGKSKAGLLTLSRYPIDSALRRSLPIQTDFAKILDLDRCYSVNRIGTADGRQLCLYQYHLSAYTTDKTVVTRQLAQLTEDMMKDYEQGNYVIAGGDTNMDLLEDSSKIFGVKGKEYSWASPFPEDQLPEGLSLVAPFDPQHPVPSCRNCDIGYIPGKTFIITVDGFLVSDNVKVRSAEVRDLQFQYSDHNPVSMTFELKSPR